MTIFAWDSKPAAATPRPASPNGGCAAQKEQEREQGWSLAWSLKKMP